MMKLSLIVREAENTSSSKSQDFLFYQKVQWDLVGLCA